MPEPSVDWRYIFDDPIECSGSGGTLSATATFEVDWTDREAFVNQALGLPTGSAGWPLPQVPWDCPFQPNSGLLASSFRFRPHTLKSTIGGSDNTVSGHFEKAWVTIGFERPRYDYDVPTSQNQIDVTNPILFCEQSIDSSGRSVTVPGYCLEYVGAPSGVVPVGPVFYFEIQSTIVLTFPFVPFIPWNYLESYIGKVNDRTLFGRAAGTLCLEAPSTRIETFSDGTTRSSCVLRLSYKSEGWNKQIASNGISYTVRNKATGALNFPEANLALIWS
jgi:hypothetical protein